MKYKRFIPVFLLLAVTVSWAGEKTDKPAEPRLVAGDVVRFINTYPVIKKELRRLGMKYERKSGDITVPEALKANSELWTILKKHGWGDRFFNKLVTIHWGFSALVYRSEIKGANKEIEKALAEVDSNPHLSEDMKKQLKQQILAAQGAVANMGTTFDRNIHPQDIALIKARLKDLRKVIEDRSDN